MNKRGNGDWDLVCAILIVGLVVIGLTRSCNETTDSAIKGCYAAGGIPVMNGMDFKSCEIKK